MAAPDCPPLPLLLPLPLLPFRPVASWGSPLPAACADGPRGPGVRASPSMEQGPPQLRCMRSAVASAADSGGAFSQANAGGSALQKLPFAHAERAASAMKEHNSWKTKFHRRATYTHAMRPAELEFSMQSTSQELSRAFAGVQGSSRAMRNT